MPNSRSELTLEWGVESRDNNAQLLLCVASDVHPGNVVRVSVDKPVHRFADLSTQLVLDADDKSISGFLETHAPLDADVRLADAPFWSTSQATFLREKILDDADWVEVVDQLNASLRAITH